MAQNMMMMSLFNNKNSGGGMGMNPLLMASMLNGGGGAKMDKLLMLSLLGGMGGGGNSASTAARG